MITCILNYLDANMLTQCMKRDVYDCACLLFQCIYHSPRVSHQPFLIRSFFFNLPGFYSQLLLACWFI